MGEIGEASGGRGLPSLVDFTMPIEGMEMAGRYHVLDYRWEGGSPVLLLGILREDDGELLQEEGYRALKLDEVDEVEFGLSSRGFCVGRFEEGIRIPCPHGGESGFNAQCERCVVLDLPDPRCVFEPHCHTDPCGAPFCKAEHFVYVAMYRDLPKVGMTQAHRLAERGTEQGADVMLPLARLGDRFSARVVEKAVSSRLGIPQAINHSAFLRNLTRPLEMDRIVRRAVDIRRRVEREWDSLIRIYREDLEVVRDPSGMEEDPIPLVYPLKEPLPSRPIPYRGSFLKGKVEGSKGRYMFVRASGLAAFNMADAVGRILFAGEMGLPEGL